MGKVSKVTIAEVVVRALSMVLAAAAAAVIGSDDEKKEVMLMERKAYIKMLPVLWVAMVMVAVAASYHFVQLCRFLVVTLLGKNPCKDNKFCLWVNLLLDQGITYVTFTACLSGGQGSLIALTGVKALQWEKVCHFYPRFCVQIAIGIAIGAIAFVCMLVVNALSAYRLFRLYPSDNAKPVDRVSRWALF